MNELEFLEELAWLLKIDEDEFANEFFIEFSHVENWEFKLLKHIRELVKERLFDKKIR